MKNETLMSVKFDYTDDDWYSDFTYYLCDYMLREFVDLPEEIDEIEVVITTKPLSKHSLKITRMRNYYCDFICVEKIAIDLATRTAVGLRELFEDINDKPMYATIYYRG